MTPSCQYLFEVARDAVTRRDIVDFCTRDPGYRDYVAAFQEIRVSPVPPSESHFAISETIGLTQWTKPEEYSDPDRFRRFRVFTNAVGIGLWFHWNDNFIHAPNYLAIGLIDDLHALGDESLLAHLPQVFEDLRHTLAAREDSEAIFLLLGQLVLAFMGHAPGVDPAELAKQILAEESQYAEWGGGREDGFLWRCTFFDSLKNWWIRFIKLSFPKDSDNEWINLLRESLNPGGW
ncbi:MAG: hypothetical protein QM755_18670 [Luteolibacter sp.]